MQYALLFRFHKEPVVCADRLALLRMLNPTVPIYGLYGGTPEDRASISESVAPLLDDFFDVQGVPGLWKWVHGDLLYRRWFRERGHRFAFDSLVIAEWDLVLAAPLDDLYAGVPADTVGLTGLVPYADIAEQWTWTTSARWWPRQWTRLRAYMKTKLGYDQEPMASQGPGWLLPRVFLDRYAAVEDPPALCHDEVRLPLYAQHLDVPMVDTGFLRRWYAPEEHALFNCTDDEIDMDRIVHELLDVQGRRVFHPCRQPIMPALRHAGWEGDTRRVA